ncbi:tRNA pseudouridine(38-40) synthase TruA [Culicoidibacter larvae]|nr:tRNA pseudouridine(38-40) synthase TruA [Culicoidibacter larvae]
MRICCIVQYDGSRFAGFQRQPGLRTIQGTIEAALKKLFSAEVIIHASGRTDAGVHAMAQVFHFDMPFDIPEENIKLALNRMVMPDIYITDVFSVNDEFNARFDAVAKEYRYKIINLKNQPFLPMKNDYYSYVNMDLDHEKILAAIPLFIGEHDFASFASLRRSKHTTTWRTIHRLEYYFDADGNYEFRICGSGFLRYMVRTIVGTLLQVGSGRFTIEDIEDMFAAPDRRKAGKSAEPNGLYLWRVWYDDADDYKNKE